MATKSNGLSVLCSSIASAYAAAHSTGDLLDGVCKAVSTRYKGEDVPDTDADFICDEVARIRQWHGNSVKTRKSEMRAILAVYNTLPEAMAKLRTTKKNEKPVTFEAGLKLARALKKGSTVAQAVAAYIEGRGAAATKPEDRDLDASKKSAATHVNRILEHTALPRAFRNALRDLCEEAGIVL